MKQEDFDALGKILYKQYGSDENYMNRVNTEKYKKKLEKMLQFLKDMDYIK